jgi:hypothetical protein
MPTVVSLAGRAVAVVSGFEPLGSSRPKARETDRNVSPERGEAGAELILLQEPSALWLTRRKRRFTTVVNSQRHVELHARQGALRTRGDFPGSGPRIDIHCNKADIVVEFLVR